MRDTTLKLNYEARDYISIGPNFKITTNDPRPNADSSGIFHIYSFTKENNQYNQIFNESGSFKILNDKGIEIVAGNKGAKGDVDICITSKSGDITITAASDGTIKIKGHNIMIEAGEDIDLKAGRNINLKAGSGRIVLDADKVDDLSMKGTGVNNSFLQRAFCLAHNYDTVSQIAYGQDLLSSLVGVV